MCVKSSQKLILLFCLTPPYGSTPHINPSCIILQFSDIIFDDMPNLPLYSLDQLDTRRRNENSLCYFTSPVTQLYSDQILPANTNYLTLLVLREGRKFMLNAAEIQSISYVNSINGGISSSP